MFTLITSSNLIIKYLWSTDRFSHDNCHTD